jgi:hypothetical protein
MIPKQAYFVYGEHRTNPLTERCSKNISDFRSINPDWKVNLITIDEADSQFDDIFHWSKVAWSQVIRFDLILRMGGLYSDVDVQYFAPMLDTNGSELVIAIETHRHITDAWFAACPGHPVIEEAFHKAVKWCRSKMRDKVPSLRSGDILNEISCGMFGDVVRRQTGLNFFSERQSHMTFEDFGGKFHPERGVGILPFEALCRHNMKNWFGWHECQGSWRPKDETGKRTTDHEAMVKVNYGKPD